MKYSQFISRHEDIEAGQVWFYPRGFGRREVVKVSCTGTNRAIYCEALEIDENFRWIYERDVKEKLPKLGAGSIVVMNRWYRDLLDLGSPSQVKDVELEVCRAPFGLGLYFSLRACLMHPQAIVRVATWLGLLGMLLGVIGARESIRDLLHWNLICGCQ
jgi:hypothetical protein